MTATRPPVGTELEDEGGWRIVVAHDGEGYWVMDKHGAERHVSVETAAAKLRAAEGRATAMIADGRYGYPGALGYLRAAVQMIATQLENGEIA